MRASILAEGCDGHRSIVSVYPRDVQRWSLSGTTAESSAVESLPLIAMKDFPPDPAFLTLHVADSFDAIDSQFQKWMLCVWTCCIQQFDISGWALDKSVYLAPAFRLPLPQNLLSMTDSPVLLHERSYAHDL